MISTFCSIIGKEAEADGDFASAGREREEMCVIFKDGKQRSDLRAVGELNLCPWSLRSLFVFV